MTWNTCFKCQSKMWIDDELNASALKARGVIPFYCSYGHRQFYVEGESETDRLRRERDQALQRIAQRDDEIARQRSLRETTERQLSATKGVITRIKNRVGRGVCPCCNRTFENVHRHMTTKHPTYAAEAAE